MRIGVDMLAIQSPHHGQRGIGRFAHNLVSALLDRARRRGHELVLYAHAGLPLGRADDFPADRVREIGPERGGDTATVTQRMDRLVAENPDGLDLFLILSAFEPWGAYMPPARPPRGLKLAALIHDMIPFLFPRESAFDPLLMRYYRGLDELRDYDLLLTNSEATRRDTLNLLGGSPARVVTIGGGCRPSLFSTDPDPESRRSASGRLEALGIRRPFLLNVGGVDERKNTRGVIEAFSRLPAHLRSGLQLVLTFDLTPGHRDEFRGVGRGRGIADAMVFTGVIDDEMLRLLYQTCAAFVMPSSYEGFGLPLLEAMACGAVVIAGNNSAQVEVVGDAGLLANASDPGDIAAKIARVLDDDSLAAMLRGRATARAARFRWEDVADRTLDAAECSGTRRRGRTPVVGRGRPRKPRIAFFSPFPPRKSGVSDYSALLLDELKSSYTIDLFHDVGYHPDLGLGSDEFECIDARLFDLYAGQRGYHANVYQMGNSRYHAYLYETMFRHPGVATLHDFCLAGFHLNYGRMQGQERGYILGELRRWYPEHAAEIDATFAAPRLDWEAVAKECAGRGWHLNRRLFDSDNLVIVHSPWCIRQVAAHSEDHAGRTVMIPHGIWPRRGDAAERAAIRARFDLDERALIVASFGFIHPDKMNPEALDAFVDVAREEPRALFVFVGEDADGGYVRRHAASLGLLDRVRFLGRQGWAEFNDLIAVTDVGVNLRLPPTNGETSGALLILLASGVPTVVTDVGTFADYPDDVVRKVRWERDGIDGLRRAMLELVRDPGARGTLGRSALDYVTAHHEWSRVAEQYVEVIERSHRERTLAARRYRRTRALVGVS